MRTAIGLKFLFLGLILSLLSFPSAAQNGGYKSLNEIKRSNLHDSNKAKEYILLYFNDYTGCVDSLTVGQPYLNAALKTFIKYQMYNGICDASHFISSYSTMVNNNGKALEYAFISLKYGELSKNTEKAGRAYRNVGLIYYNQRRWKEALNYFEKSIVLIRKHPHSDLLNTPIYLAGLCKISLKQYTEAIVLLDEAMGLAYRKNDSLRVYECLGAKGKALVGLGKFEEANKYLQKTLVFYIGVGENTAISSIYYDLSRIELIQKNYKKALELIQKANFHDSLSGFHLYQMDISKMLYEIYQILEKPEKALIYLKVYNDARDSLLNRDLLSEIAVTQATYEFKKTEDRINQELVENEIKKKRANYVILIFGAFIFLGSIGFVTVRNERKKSDALLLNILPKNTAYELKKFGSAKPKNHESVSIMFCDVESFTKISEKLSAEDIVKMLNHYFGGFDRIVGEFKIEKIKTIGDAYMCVAGLQNEANHAENMVRAAIKFRNFLQETAVEMELTYGMSLNFRIGINSGNVVSGVVGTKKYAYDIWGDAVNIAARMEQTSEPGKINISENTYLLIKNMFTTTYRGEIAAKNKAAMNMYFVES